MTGKVYLIGAGPGSSDLVTSRGLSLLKKADVVLYDYLISYHLLCQ
ncbi:MAG: uroporphyrin-III C-methyltransferase, partial [Ruminobacter sp.]|nr:uroporphyrin-III C-methyltransferase [Ruminobacter sp.]